MKLFGVDIIIEFSFILQLALSVVFVNIIRNKDFTVVKKIIFSVLLISVWVGFYVLDLLYGH